MRYTLALTSSQCLRETHMDKYHFRICLAAFLLDGALMVILTAMPFYIYDHLHGDVATPGYIGGIQSMLYAITCMVISGWMNRNKHSMRIAAFGASYFCIGSAVAVLVPGIWGFGAASVISIMGMSIVWPSLHGWLGADPDPHIRSRSMSRFNVSWSGGLAVGPLVGGFLYDTAPLAPFAASALLGVACFLLLWSIPQEEDYYKTLADEREPEWGTHALRSEQILKSAWIANGMSWALVAVTRLIFTKRVDNLVDDGTLRLFAEAVPPNFLTHNPASIYATIAFLLAATSAAVFGLMGRTRHWQHRFRYLAGLQVASAVAFWVLGYTYSLAAMSVAFMVIGAFSGAAFFSSSYYSMANFALRRQRSSINEFFVGFGSFVGPLIFGYLAERQGLRAPFTYMPIIIALGLALQYYLIVQGKKRIAVDS